MLQIIKQWMLLDLREPALGRTLLECGDLQWDLGRMAEARQSWQQAYEVLQQVAAVQGLPETQVLQLPGLYRRTHTIPNSAR